MTFYTFLYYDVSILLVFFPPLWTTPGLSKHQFHKAKGRRDIGWSLNTWRVWGGHQLRQAIF